MHRMTLSEEGGTVEVNGRTEPMPPAMWREERAQFGFYRQLQAAWKRAPSVAAAGADTFSVEGPVRTWFRVAADGSLAGAFNDIPAGDGGRLVRQHFEFEGWWTDSGAVFPRHMAMTRGGKPYFTLDVESFHAE
jgi:hypothetical protein